eukprot:1159656-Pelagomonas_calceolata.AAC.16
MSVYSPGEPRAAYQPLGCPRQHHSAGGPARPQWEHPWEGMCGTPCGTHGLRCPSAFYYGAPSDSTRPWYIHNKLPTSQEAHPSVPTPGWQSESLCFLLPSSSHPVL